MGQCATGMGQSSGEKASKLANINFLLENDSDQVNTSNEDNSCAKQSKRRVFKKKTNKVRKQAKQMPSKTNLIKLLLLGTGNSGKSTVFKQFQMVYANGFTDKERASYRQFIVAATVTTIRKLLLNAKDLIFEGLIGKEDVDELGVMTHLQRKAASKEAGETRNSGGLSFTEAMGLEEHEGDSTSSRKKLVQANTSDISVKSQESRRSDSKPADLKGKRESDHSASSVQRKESNSRNPLNGPVGSFLISKDVEELSELVQNLNDGASLREKKRFPIFQSRNGDEEEVPEMTVAELLRKIWEDPIIQIVYSMENKMPTLECSIEYYMSQLDRFSQPDFKLTDEDILQSRRQTRHVDELKFTFDGGNFVLIDVGGQRIERRKWINYFENVDAVLFVVGLDGYNQVCMEDGRTNRMREALVLFKDICNSPYFTQTNILLFLNKSDLFKDKIKTVPLSVCFKSYTGKKHNFEQSIAHIRTRFEDIHSRCAMKRTYQSAIPRVYTHVTCATSTEHMRFIIASCQAIFLRQGLVQCGISAL